MTGDVAVAILAGGEGRRIGGGKAVRQFAGERLIDRALRNARSWSDLTIVSVRDAGQVEPLGASVITDQRNIAGPLAGLVSALQFAAESGRDLVLTIPADMPFLPANLLDRLRSAIRDGGCAIASSGGHLHPVCALWRTSALKQVGRYLAGEQRSLRRFASRIGFSEVEWSTEPFDPFFNINTAEELAEAERRASG